MFGFLSVFFILKLLIINGLEDFVINAFPGIIKAKTTVQIDTSEAANNSEGIKSIEKIKLYEETRWLLKDIDITDRRHKIFRHLFMLFTCIFCGCAMIFWRFLLFEISFSCDDDDNAKDCFEYNFSRNWEAFKALERSY